MNVIASRRTFFVLVALCVLLPLKEAGAQRGAATSTSLLVRVDESFGSSGRIEIQVESLEKTVELGRSKQIEMTLPMVEGVVTFRARFISAFGSTQGAWSNSITLNGSGRGVYILDRNGTGKAFLWPVVVLASRAEPLRVLIDSDPQGITKTSKIGVRPDQELQFVWRNDQKIVCQVARTLASNEVRTLTCDPATGKVTP